MKMANQKYAEYSQDVYNEFFSLMDRIDTTRYKRFISQIQEVAKKTGSMEWNLRAEYYQWYLIRMYVDYGKLDYSEEYRVALLFDLLKKVQKAGVVNIELLIRFSIIDTYWYRIKNYELTLEQCELQYQLLQTISSEDIPEIGKYYVQIANIYYAFKDYSKTIFYLEKILSEKETTSNQWSWKDALNTMGLCYRYGFNDLDRSDSCFRAILQTEKYFIPREEHNREYWDGIAEGNLGYNMLLRGAFSNAIPLLKSSIEKTLKYNDYAYASGPAINLADIYTKTGNLPEAKRYIDLAREYQNKMNRAGRLSRIYEVLNKYYAAVGNATLSMAYLDSMKLAQQEHEAEYNTMLLLRMEQKELAQRQKELVQEKQILTKTQFWLILLAVAFIIIFVLSVFLFFLYAKKRAAYRKLALNTQEWAATKTIILEPEQSSEVEKQDTIPDKYDIAIMNNIERLLLEEKSYRQTSFTIDTLAKKLNLKKHTVSETINRCTNKNFNTFINEYRIKEAVKCISEDTEKFSFEGIAWETGFNDRKSFYRAFKKITGLTPGEFRKNASL